MMMKRRVFSPCAAVFLIATPVLVQAKGAAETRLRAALTGTRINNLTASGHADIRARQGISRLNGEVEDVYVAPGTILDVYLERPQIGTITVAPVTLCVELALNSNDGDMVPSVEADALVVVKNGGGSIVAGVF